MIQQPPLTYSDPLALNMVTYGKRSEMLSKLNRMDC